MSQLERIVAACGGVLLDGGARALIPGPGHSHKDRSVSLAETEEGRILIHCFSPADDWRAVRRALAERGLLAPAAESGAAAGERAAVIAQPANEDRVARAQRFWEEARSIRCTPASIYLQRRHIERALMASDALRFHSRATSVDDRLRRPALVAAISGADGALQGVQVTLLMRYGEAKANVATPRRIIGRLLGGAVRLMDAKHTLIVAEGVETALSAGAYFGAPAWAALSAHNLSVFTPPPMAQHLVIAADADAAGLAAAAALKARLALDVEIAPAPEGFKDWNAWASAAL